MTCLNILVSEWSLYAPEEKWGNKERGKKKKKKKKKKRKKNPVSVTLNNNNNNNNNNNQRNFKKLFNNTHIFDPNISEKPFSVLSGW